MGGSIEFVTVLDKNDPCNNLILIISLALMT